MPPAVGPDPTRRGLPSSGQRLRAGLVRRKELAGLHRPPYRSNQTGRHRPKPTLPCTPSKQSRKSITAAAKSKRTSTETLVSVVVLGASSCTLPFTVRPSSCPARSIPRASKFASGFWPALRSPLATASSRPWSRVWIQSKPAPTASPAAAKLKPPDDGPLQGPKPPSRGSRTQNNPL